MRMWVRRMVTGEDEEQDNVRGEGRRKMRSRRSRGTRRRTMTGGGR